MLWMKVLLCSLGASAATLIPTVTLASTSPVTYKPTTISVKGHKTLHVQHIVAKDPWSGVETTWIRIDDVKETLRRVGIVTTWNTSGTSFSLVKYPPGHALRALGNPEVPPNASGIRFHLVAGAPPSGHMPKLVMKDPTTGAELVYMPIYYLNHMILNAYWKMNSHWNGQSNVWSLDFQPVE